MEVSKLFDLSYDYELGGSKSYDMGRGRLNGVMVVGQSINYSDSISIKIRGRERTEILANRLSFALLSTISDMKYGLKARNSAQQEVNLIWQELQNHTDFEVTGERLRVANNKLRGVYVDLGHVSLGESEIEISIEAEAIAGKEGSNKYSVYSVYSETMPDIYKQYDETKDFDSIHGMVREVYFHSRFHLVDENGEFEQIQFQIDNDDGTILSDLQGMLVASNIFSNTEWPETQNLRVYSDDLPVPSRVRVKVTGADHATQSLVFVKEIIPKEVSTSTLENLRRIQERVVKLERENAELAKRYRHAGKTVKSEELSETEAVIEAGNRADEGSQ